MSECLKCGKKAQYDFCVLEVRTLYVRDFRGESRVQALGKTCTYSICDSCVESQMEAILHSGGLLRNCGKYLAIAIAGVVLTAFLWEGENALRILGPAAIVCGILGIIGTFRTVSEKKQSYAALPFDEMKEQAAWDVLVQAAPCKSEDAEITYIPITPKTLAMKNGDLMIAFDLLPDIALEAYGRLHEKKS